MPQMIPVSLSRLLIREMADLQVVELREVAGTRRFPIAIGLPEAFAIERRCKGISVERPQTHDLLASVISKLGGELVRVEINDLQEGTFIARLILHREGAECEVDARPSDALALAVAGDTPILVADHVLQEAAIDASSPDGVSQFSGEDDEVDEDEDNDEED
ncbi:MAG: bifunctional nuclease family protein [Planctomycetota bacterium]|nr:bifunctional nuclease family protein [Planctomycetota bacterium]MDA1105687.1 bifunctional nuclease family protein [Planctomycetota bacterium]